MPPVQVGVPTPVDQAASISVVVRRKFRPVSLVTLLPFIVLIGAMFLMTRSAKKKQQAAAQMRDDMQPGTGVRTIGGMYATVKEIQDDTVLLEVAPGVHAVDELEGEATVVPDDASSLTDGESAHDDVAKIDLGKKPEDDAAPKDTEVKGSEVKDAKADGEGDAK